MLSKQEPLSKNDQLALYYKTKELLDLLKDRDLKFNRNDLQKLTEGASKDERRLIRESLKARDKLVLSNLGLVHRCAANYIPTLSYDDAISLGLQGVIHAIHKFNPTKNTKFSSYAYLWIKYYLIKGLSRAKLIKIPTRLQQKLAKLSTLSNADRAFFSQWLYSYISWDNLTKASPRPNKEVVSPHAKDSLVNILLSRLTWQEQSYIIDMYQLDGRPPQPLMQALQFKDFDTFGWAGLNEWEDNLFAKCEQILNEIIFEGY